MIYTIAWFLAKALLLLLVMALGGVLAAYGIAFRFVMGLEARPSTIARFAWLCWGLVGLGVLTFVYGGSTFARLVMA